MLPCKNRRTGRRIHPLHGCWMLAALLLMTSTGARAVPAFARQTGWACANCHAPAYGPYLTPLGTRFKLSGYTITDGKTPKIPLAAQLIGTRSFPARGKDRTDLTEADLFLAGRVSDHVGGFVKVEADYTGDNDYNVRLSTVDLRFVLQDVKIGDKSLKLGVSVNNSPGFQDPLTVLPAATRLGPPGVTGTLLNPSSPNAPNERVIGATVYGLYDSDWYGEIGTYRSLSTSQQDHLGYSVSGDPGKLSDTGYFRLAYMKDLGNQFFSAGVVSMSTKRQLPRNGPKDDLTDIGYDLSYQYLGSNRYILQASYVNIFERRRYGRVPTSPVPGLVARGRGHARDQILTLSYTFAQSYTLTVAHLLSTGSHDAVRYRPYGKPDTTSNLISLYWTPFGKYGSFTHIANLKLAATWFRFSRFNGSSSNIFGAPPGAPVTDAKDLNAFFVNASIAF